MIQRKGAKAQRREGFKVENKAIKIPLRLRAFTLKIS